ncbi:coronin-2B isoform X2 [Halyomorpha halys]|uniref:coronin-2B isoform X2 n=1 Tax=Halyomorpha halys TaxID=286706 RepID=UPI0006D4D408|nr:coronin-2B isoform X2 [Halyomorpha halys]
MTNTQLWFRGVRNSKFRHVYGQPVKRENCYDNVNITKNAHDSQFCAVNPKFIAIVTEVAGGGAFIVLPLEKTGRVDFNAYKISGHSGPVLDIKWNPFNDNVIASCSDDCTIKLWYVPEGGLSSNVTDWIVDLHAHKRRVGYIEWHPTAENIIASVGFDYLVIIWDVGKGEALNIIDCHTDVVHSFSFNRDGSRIATTSKDKKLRIIDPRTGLVISEGICHNGNRCSKAVYLKNGLVATVGFSKRSDRELAIWNENSLVTPLANEYVDSSSGIIFPYFDYDTNILFLAGKGDGNIRYYEIVDSAPWVHFLNQYLSGLPQRSLGIMPKRGCNVTQCEIFRFYKLHTTKPLCEPVSMIVPRKSDQFQDDLYPDTAAPVPSVSASDWANGVNKPPILMSMKTGVAVKTHKPKISTAAENLNSGSVGNKYHMKMAFLSQQTIPDYRPLDQRDTVPDIVQNTINNHICHTKEELMNNAENEKNAKTSSNQSTKFQQIQRKFGKPIFSEDKYNKLNENDSEVKSYNQLQRSYDRLSEEVLLLRKQLTLKDKRIEELESEIKYLKSTIEKTA